VGKPVKHGDKWRIRWLDERGERQSAVRDDYKVAQTELRRRQVEVEEVRRGLRNAPPPEKTGGDLFDYWLEKRALRKRSQKDDESILRKHLRPRFGAMRLRDIGVEDGDEYLSEKIDDEGLSDKTVNPDRPPRHGGPRAVAAWPLVVHPPPRRQANKIPS
jgi:hypothetical protein